MAGSKLTLATGRRHDTKFLLTGEVRVRDFEIDCIDAGPAPFPIFRDMVNDISYDIGEQAFSHYLIAKDMGKPLTAIPVFPSRFFPQLGVTVNRQAGIREPADLVGKRVGLPSFGYNPGAWLRGILVHQYEVPVEKIIWVEEAEDPFFGKLNYRRPKRFTVEQMSGLQTMGATSGPPRCVPLETGQIDAFIGPGGGFPLVETTRRLFADPYQEIDAYLQRTSVFPINTVMTLKEEVVKAHPQLTRRLMEAFYEAKIRYQAEVLTGAETIHMDIELGELRKRGLFPDQYGMEPNLPAIRMMIQYCYEQGLIRTLYKPEDLFVS